MKITKPMISNARAWRTLSAILRIGFISAKGCK